MSAKYCQCPEPDVKQVNICGLNVPFCKLCKNERDESKVEAASAEEPARKVYSMQELLDMPLPTRPWITPEMQDEFGAAPGALMHTHDDFAREFMCHPPGLEEPITFRLPRARDLLQPDTPKSMLAWLSKYRQQPVMPIGAEFAMSGRFDVITMEREFFDEKCAKASDLVDAVVYANLAAGKTSLGVRWPEPAPLLQLDTEGLFGRRRRFPNGSKTTLYAAAYGQRDVPRKPIRFHFSEDWVQLELRLMAAASNSAVVPPGEYTYRVVGTRIDQDGITTELRPIDGFGGNVETKTLGPQHMGAKVKLSDTTRRSLGRIGKAMQQFSGSAYAASVSLGMLAGAFCKERDRQELMLQKQLMGCYPALIGVDPAAEAGKLVRYNAADALLTHKLYRAGLKKYVCPVGKEGDDVRGCGATIEATPDDEGLVDCYECGIWFNPKTEDCEVKEDDSGAPEVSAAAYCSCPAPDFRPQVVLGEHFEVCHTCNKEKRS
jgi:hypothetical protein